MATLFAWVFAYVVVGVVLSVPLVRWLTDGWLDPADGADLFIFVLAAVFWPLVLLYVLIAAAILSCHGRRRTPDRAQPRGPHTTSAT